MPTNICQTYCVWILFPLSWQPFLKCLRCLLPWFSESPNVGCRLPLCCCCCCYYQFLNKGNYNFKLFVNIVDIHWPKNCWLGCCCFPARHGCLAVVSIALEIFSVFEDLLQIIFYHSTELQTWGCSWRCTEKKQQDSAISRIKIQNQKRKWNEIFTMQWKLQNPIYQSIDEYCCHNEIMFERVLIRLKRVEIFGP